VKLVVLLECLRQHFFLNYLMSIHREIYLRHAQYYQLILSTADDLYVNGGTDLQRSYQLIDLEWQNVQSGQSWAEAYSGKDEEAARLCSVYPGEAISLLTLRQHARERIRWLKAALGAARKLKDRVSEGAHLGILAQPIQIWASLIAQSSF
jgi:hypothetical protein